jgi:hypothetical protein
LRLCRRAEQGPDRIADAPSTRGRGAALRLQSAAPSVEKIHSTNLILPAPLTCLLQCLKSLERRRLRSSQETSVQPPRRFSIAPWESRLPFNFINLFAQHFQSQPLLFDRCQPVPRDGKRLGRFAEPSRIAGIKVRVPQDVIQLGNFRLDRLGGGESGIRTLGLSPRGNCREVAHMTRRWRKRDSNRRYLPRESPLFEPGTFARFGTSPGTEGSNPLSLPPSRDLSAWNPVQLSSFPRVVFVLRLLLGVLQHFRQFRVTAVVGKDDKHP